MAAERRSPIKKNLVTKKYKRLSVVDWHKGYSAVPGRLGMAERAKVTERARAIREQVEELGGGTTYTSTGERRAL